MDDINIFWNILQKLETILNYLDRKIHCPVNLRSNNIWQYLSIWIHELLYNNHNQINFKIISVSGCRNMVHLIGMICTLCVQSKDHPKILLQGWITVIISLQKAMSFQLLQQQRTHNPLLQSRVLECKPLHKRTMNFLQAFWQGAGKKGKMCRILKGNCAGRKDDCAWNCAGLCNFLRNKIFGPWLPVKRSFVFFT